MIVKKIAIRNFTVFSELDLEVCNGINVLIGVNGTGKTHLLKGIYAVCEVLDKEKDFSETTYPTIIVVVQHSFDNRKAALHFHHMLHFGYTNVV